MKSKLQIESLARHQNLILTIAQWYFAVFAREGTPIEKFENAIRNRLNMDSLDCCFLAFIEGEVVGTVSLTANDIPTKPTLTPCVMQLSVSEKYRHKHIGQSLVEFASTNCEIWGFTKHIFTRLTKLFTNGTQNSAGKLSAKARCTTSI